MLRFFRILKHGLQDDDTHLLFVATGVIILLGTVVYTLIEDWSIVDSLYFSVVTLTTVGYGDLSPGTTFTKIFTTFYILIGVGLLVSFGTTFVRIAGELKKAESEACADEED